jgi:uncharacterized membrane protein
MATARNELPLGRLEALSDGVFAIAITLLVLELAVDRGEADHALRAILDEWPSYLAYVTSFLTIGVVWMAHSRITSALRAADGTLYRLNPARAPARLVPALPDEARERVRGRGRRRAGRCRLLRPRAAGAGRLVDLSHRYAFGQRELLKEHVEKGVAAEAARYRPSYLYYGVAIAVGFLLPFVAVGLYLAIALYLAVPARTIRRLARAG